MVQINNILNDTLYEFFLTSFCVNLQNTLKSFEQLFFLWVMKNVAFVTTFSLYCERFYMCVSEVDAVCSRLLRSLQSTGKTKPTLSSST